MAHLASLLIPLQHNTMERQHNRRQKKRVDLDVAGGVGSASENTHFLCTIYPLDHQFVSRCLSANEKKKKPK